MKYEKLDNLNVGFKVHSYLHITTFDVSEIEDGCERCSFLSFHFQHTCVIFILLALPNIYLCQTYRNFRQVNKRFLEEIISEVIDQLDTFTNIYCRKKISWNVTVRVENDLSDSFYELQILL